MHIRWSKTLQILFSPLLWGTKWLGIHYPELLVRIRYHVRFHKKLNLKNPQTLNEKILYLSLRTDTTEWTRLADKYSVREYVKECGLEDTLTKLYAHWTNEKEVDLDSLPNEFVIKSVQGCGDVIIVKDKSKINCEKILSQIHFMFHNRYGALEGGKHYLRIEPAVIVEELLPIERIGGGEEKDRNSIVDYKLWCFNGHVYYIMTCSSRKKHSVCLGLYDKQWNYRPQDMIFTSEYQEEAKPIAKPKNFNNMCLVAERLSKGFPCVRVDLYNIKGHIYFGEMTFTSLGGMMNYYTDECLLRMGSQINLNYKG